MKPFKTMLAIPVFAGLILSSLPASAERLCMLTALEEVISGRISYSARSPLADIFIEGHLSPSEGILRLDLQMRGTKGDQVYRANPRNEFRKMLDHFGDRVTRIHDEWGFHNEDVVEEFNKNIRAGMKKEEAAAATSLGKLFTQEGFTKVIVEEAFGPPGDFHEIHVQFSRPKVAR